jgi:hypothetical protein
MASPIIAAIRKRRDLKESLRHTAQELAHLASIYGVARVSLRYLAWKCGCCKQTIINHLQKLIALKIIRKRVMWIRGNCCEINTYHFLISWEKQPAQKGSSQNFGPNLPPREEGEKHTGLGEEIHTLEKGLRFCSPGSPAYESTLEKLARLRGLAYPFAGEGLQGVSAASDSSDRV